MAPLTCGLYVGGETLSLLALQPLAKKGWAVQGGASDFHTLGEEDELAPAIKALARPLKLAKTEVAAVLPKKQAILRNVLLPSIDREELAQMARFEAERHIPFHAERHSTGFHVMRSMGVEGSEVLLGAVDSPIVQRLLDGVIAAGLAPRCATLSSVSLVNSLLYHRRDWLKGKTVALLCPSLDALDLVFISDGRVLFARSVAMDLRGVLEAWLGFSHAGGDPALRPGMDKLALAARMIDCTNLEGNYGAGGAPTADTAELVRTWIDRVIQEMRRTYDFARREMKCPPVDAVALTGEGAALRNLGQYLYVNMNVEIVTFNPLDGLTRRKGVKFPFDGLEFAIPFGAAIAGQLDGAYRIDLTPQEHYRQLARKRLVRQLTGSSVILLIALGLGVGAWLLYQNINGQLMAAYSSINSKMSSRVGQLRERKTKLDIIRDFMNDPNSALPVLKAIAEIDIIPSRVTMTKVNYVKAGQEGPGRVEIEGDAKTLPDVNQFIQKLRDSGRFADVSSVMNPTPSSVNQQGMYSFKLECVLGGGKSAETEGSL